MTNIPCMRAEALEKELESIKANSQISPAPTAGSGGPQSESNTRINERGTVTAPTVQPHLERYSSTYPEYQGTVTAASFQPMTLGEVELSPFAIAQVINCFYAQFQDDFPILPEATVFARGYNRCPLLFWVIVAIASKSMDSYSHVRSQLEPHIRVLATSCDSAVDHPLGTVQALLLLCWWPFSFQATRNDPSWTYCGLAVHTALRAGLHRPRHFSDFVYRDELDEVGTEAFTKAWVGCFIVNQILSSELGIPSTASPDSTIIAVLNEQSGKLSPVLEQHLRIAYQSYNICQTLGNHDLSTSGLMPSCLDLVRVFDRGFHELEARLTPEVFLHVKMALLRVKLQLYSFSITEAATSTNGLTLESRAADSLSKAGVVAMQLINTASLHISPHSSKKPWPVIIRAAVVYASHILLRLMAYSKHVDVDRAKNSIKQAWLLLNSRSEIENDSWARVCDIIEYLSSTSSEKSPQSFKPVRARMSANVVVDSIWRARGRFSEDTLSARPADYTATESIRDVIQHGFNLLIGSEFLDATNEDILQPPPMLPLHNDYNMGMGGEHL